MYRNKKILVLAVCIGIVLVAALLGYWYVAHHTSVSSDSGSKQNARQKEYEDESQATITKVGNQPTQDFKQPSGKYVKVIAGQLVLKITDSNSVQSFGASLKAIPNAPQTYVLTVPKGKDLNQAADEAKKKPGVLYAEPRYVNTSTAVARYVPNDPQVKTEQKDYLLDISAPEGWGVNTTGAGIAILDSGVQSNHPDLAAKLAKYGGEIPGNGVDDDGNGYADDYYGMDFVNGCDPTLGGTRCTIPTSDANGAEDDNGHGTAVAGTAAAATNNSVGVAGVSWSSGILAIKYSDSQGRGDDLTMAAAIRYAISRPGVRVINMSQGRTCNGNSDCTADYLKAAIDSAVANGIVVVVSAGNTSKAGPDDALESPASYGPVIAAGGTETGVTPVVRDYGANFGSSGPQVDVSAPFSVYTTNKGSTYSSWSGTSFSSPEIAGAAALILGINPGLAPARVEAILKATADGPSNRGVGAGRLNLYKALRYTRDCT